MNEELVKYYQYLKDNKADVPDTFESFHATLQDETEGKKYFDYLKDNDFDAPDTFESFVSTFGLKKKVASGLPSFPWEMDLSKPIESSSPATKIAITPPTLPQGDSGTSTEEIERGILDEMGVKPAPGMSIPGFTIPEPQTEFERQGAIREEQALRKGLGIDGPDPMTAMEQAGSFAGSFNKPVIDMISSVPKLGGIVRRYVDVALGNDPKPVQAYDMYKLGEAIDKKALDLGITYTDPRNAGSFFGEGVPSGLGSVLAIMSAGGGMAAEGALAKTSVKELGLLDAGKLAAKDLGRMATTRPVAAGANMMGIQEFQQAKAAGATDEMALDVYFKNLPIGATEAIPMERAFGRIANFTGGLGQVAKASTVGALEESTQEGLQQWLTNKVAAGTYDPKREPWKDLMSSMGVGAFIGFFLPMIGKVGQVVLNPQQQKETLEAINETLKEEQKANPPVEKPEPKPAVNEKPKPQPAEVKPEPAVVPETPKEAPLPVSEGEKEPISKAVEVPEDLQDRGEPVPSVLVAKTRFGNGDRIFAFPEQDEKPFEVTSVDVMDKYLPEQLLAYPSGKADVVEKPLTDQATPGQFVENENGDVFKVTEVVEKNGFNTVYKIEDKDGNEFKINAAMANLSTTDKSFEGGKSEVFGEKAIQLGNPPQNYKAEFGGKDGGKFKTLGKNENGDLVGEDENGVRATMNRKGIIRSQPVGIIPGGGITVDSPTGDFLTVEEQAKAEKPKIEKESELTTELETLKKRQKEWEKMPIARASVDKRIAEIEKELGVEPTPPPVVVEKPKPVPTPQVPAPWSKHGAEPVKEIEEKPEQPREFRSPQDVSRITAQTLPSHLRDVEVTIKNTEGKPVKMKAKEAYVEMKRLHKLLNSQKFLDCIGKAG